MLALLVRDKKRKLKGRDLVAEPQMFYTVSEGT